MHWNANIHNIFEIATSHNIFEIPASHNIVFKMCQLHWENSAQKLPCPKHVSNPEQLQEHCRSTHCGEQSCIGSVCVLNSECTLIVPPHSWKQNTEFCQICPTSAIWLPWAPFILFMFNVLSCSLLNYNHEFASWSYY